MIRPAFVNGISPKTDGFFTLAAKNAAVDGGGGGGGGGDDGGFHTTGNLGFSVPGYTSFRGMFAKIRAGGGGRVQEEEEQVPPEDLSEFSDWTDLNTAQVREYISLMYREPQAVAVTRYLLDYVLAGGLRFSEETPLFTADKAKIESFPEWIGTRADPILRAAFHQILAVGFCVTTWVPHAEFGAELKLVDLELVRLQYQVNRLGMWRVRPHPDERDASATASAAAATATATATTAVAATSDLIHTEGRYQSVMLNRPNPDFSYRDPIYMVFPHQNPLSPTGAIRSVVQCLKPVFEYAAFHRESRKRMLLAQVNPHYFVTTEHEEAKHSKFNANAVSATDFADTIAPRCITGPGGSGGALGAFSNQRSIVTAYQQEEYQRRMALAAQTIARMRGHFHHLIPLPPGHNIEKSQAPPPPPENDKVDEWVWDMVCDAIGVPQLCIHRQKAAAISRNAASGDTTDKLLTHSCYSIFESWFKPILKTFYQNAFLLERGKHLLSKKAHDLQTRGKDTKAGDLSDQESPRASKRKWLAAKRQKRELLQKRRQRAREKKRSHRRSNKSKSPRRRRTSAASTESGSDTDRSRTSSSGGSDSDSDGDDGGESDSNSSEASSSEDDEEEKKEIRTWEDVQKTLVCDIRCFSLTKLADVQLAYDQGLMALDKYVEYVSHTTNIPLTDLIGGKKGKQKKGSKQGSDKPSFVASVEGGGASGVLAAEKAKAEIKLLLEQAKAAAEKPKLERDKMKHERTMQKHEGEKAKLEMKKMDKSIEVQRNALELDAQRVQKVDAPKLALAEKKARLSSKKKKKSKKR